jgi:hypothetical protein
VAKGIKYLGKELRQNSNVEAAGIILVMPM